MIRDRKKQIDQIEKIMTNVNALAKDLAFEVNDQGIKLGEVDKHVTIA